MKKVAITDYTFDDLAIEKGILEPEGLEIEGIKVFESQDTMIDLVRDAKFTNVSQAVKMPQRDVP